MSAWKTSLQETIGNYDEFVYSGKRDAISFRYIIETLRLFSIFNWREFQDRNSENKEVIESFNATISGLQEPIITNTRLILDYLSERFHILVGKNEFLYKPSEVITKYLIDKLNRYGIDEVVFPSTKVKGNELNVALTPDASDQKISVCKVLNSEYL